MNSSISPSNTESEPFPFLPSWRSASQPPTVIDSSWSPFLQLLSSPSLPVSRSRGLWGWLRWGVCAVAGVWFGVSAVTADHLLMRGGYEMAAKIFPWNRYVRTRVGYVTLMQGVSIDAALRALASDPWSADLTLGVGVWYHINGNEPLAQKYVARFIQIAPNSPMIHRQ